MLKLRTITETNDKFWKKFDNLSDECFLHNVQYKSAWFKPYIKNLLKGEVYIITVYEENELVGCLPLQKRKQRATRWWNYRVLDILGSGPTDFSEVLAKEQNREEILNLIFNHLKENKNWDYLNLTLLPQYSDSQRLIEKTFSNVFFKLTKQGTTGFRYEKTVDNWETYYNEVFNAKNKDLSKGERRIQKDEIDYTFTIHTGNIFENFIAAVDLYATRRETLGQYNFYEDKSYRAFLKEVCENYERFGGVAFTIMQDKEDKNMSIQLDFINKGIRYHWNHAFNEDYKRYSPGKILLKEILKNSFKDPNISACNHMRGLCGYKEAFTSYQEVLPSFKIERINSSRIKATRVVSKLLKLLK